MMSKIDVIYDQAHKELEAVPRHVLDLTNLQMLYLEDNVIEYLPLNLFQKLPRLTWLDLRNNQLKEIPIGVAYHQCLDTLLLENNRIERIPNELGLCPNLLVLQINNNPLTYPHRSILEQGALVTRKYLKSQFEKENPPFPPPPLEQSSSDSSDLSMQSCATGSSNSEPVRLPPKNTITVQELLRKASAAAKVFQKDTPVMTVKSLSPKNSAMKPIIRKVESANENPEKLTLRKVPTKFCPKLSVNSHYNSNKYLNVKKTKPNKERVIDQQTKDAWLGKLRDLLQQQEKLLQQERNLQSLNAWRLQKKMEPTRTAQQPKTKAPYDTDPEYETMLQREDLCKEVDSMVKTKKKYAKTVDMRKMISELVVQLKGLGSHFTGNNSNELERNAHEIKTHEDHFVSEPPQIDPAKKRAYELHKAESEIRRIIELHKKVTSLQTMNNSTLK